MNAITFAFNEYKTWQKENDCTVFWIDELISEKKISDFIMIFKKNDKCVSSKWAIREYKINRKMSSADTEILVIV